MSTEPVTVAGGALLTRGELVHPEPEHPGIGVRMVATSTVREAVYAIEAEAREQGAKAERERIAAAVEALPWMWHDDSENEIGMKVLGRTAVLAAIRGEEAAS